MNGSKHNAGRRRPGKNVVTTKSGNTIKVNRSLGERLKARKDAKTRQRAAYLATLPKNKFKRILYRLHPKRMAKYWFSREGALMALKITGIGIAAGFLILVGVFAYFRKDLPKINDITSGTGGTITYYDRTGTTVLWQDYDAIKRIPVSDENISNYLKQATIAVEDKDFYKHGAFDVSGIARAGLNDIFGSGARQGGSTITQQLVKMNQEWTYDRSLSRKVKELILSVELEREYSKKDILTGYLNVAPYSGIQYGAEAAARDYFNVSAKDLTLAQSAMLAGIPKSPTYLSPYSEYFDKEMFTARYKDILNKMAEQKMITEEQAKEAKNFDVLAQVKPIPTHYQGIKAPYFVLAAKKELDSVYGGKTFQRGGWKVTTTLDLKLQETAEKLVADNLTDIKRRTGGAADTEALVTSDVQTGQIVALVGGTDFNNTEYGQRNYASDILIPPGSTFKPYDFAVFIDNNNAGAGSVFYDSVGPVPGYPCSNPSRAYDPEYLECLRDYDYRTNRFPGPVTIRYALGGSRNVPAVKAMVSAVPNDTSNGKTTSIKKVISTASLMMNPNAKVDEGEYLYNCYQDPQLTKTGPCYSAAAIGDGAYLHLDDHVNGLATLGRLGVSIPKTYILKIVNGSGKVISEWTPPKGKQVIKPDTAYILNDISADPKASYLPGNCTDTNCTPLNRGGYKFHRSNGWHFAIKTGTTNDGYDGLMASWSTRYATISWVGNHDRNKDLTALRASMEQLTTPITRGIMEAAHQGIAPVNWTKPSGVKTAPAFQITRKVSNLAESIPSPNTDLYPSWYQPPNRQGASAGQVIDKVSRKTATSCTPELAKETTGGGNDNIFSVDIFYGAASRAAASAAAADDLHNCSDAKPTVTLTAPTTCSTGTACSFTVTVAKGTHAISSEKFPGTVSLIINGQKIDTKNINDSPTTVTFKHTPTSSGAATIEAQVTDSVLYSASATANTTFTTANTPNNTGNGNGNGNNNDDDNP